MSLVNRFDVLVGYEGKFLKVLDTFGFPTFEICNGLQCVRSAEGIFHSVPSINFRVQVGSRHVSFVPTDPFKTVNAVIENRFYLQQLVNDS